MSRRHATITATLALVTLFVSTLASGASLDSEMKTVEKLRGLTFEHPVALRTIKRAELPKVLGPEVVTVSVGEFFETVCVVVPVAELLLVSPA